MASIKLRRGSGVPSGLTFGEPAFDITNNRFYVGITGGSALVGVAGGGVHSFNGLTGAVTGVTTGTANTFDPLQSFTSGISSSGGTFASQVNFVSGISASGGTFNNDIFVNSVRVGRGSGSIVSNVAVGASSLNSNTTGTLNTAIGQQALQDNISGNSNTAIGRRSLLGLTTGDQNSALGTSSLVSLSRGNKCLGLGSFSGQSLSTGTGSIYIGSGSDSSSSSTVNEIVIGTDMAGLGSNTTVIGPTTQVSATIRGLLNTPNGISSAGGTFSGTLNIPSGSTLSVLGRIVGNVVNTIHGFTGGVTFAGVNGITVDTAGAIGSAGRVNIGIQTSGSTSSTSAFSFLMKTGSTSGNVTTLSNTTNLVYYHPQTSFPVTLVGSTGINIRGGGGAGLVALGAYNQISLGSSSVSGVNIYSSNSFLSIINSDGIGYVGGVTTGIILYTGNLIDSEYSAKIYPKAFSNSRTFELPDSSGTFALTEATQTFTAPQSFSSGLCASGVSAGSFILTSAGIKALTGTTYTFLASDNGDILTHDNASGCTLTIPAGLPVGFSTTVIRLNANGTVRFIPASGVTLNSYLGLTAMAGQHASASLISYSTNIFNLGGALA